MLLASQLLDRILSDPYRSSATPCSYCHWVVEGGQIHPTCKPLAKMVSRGDVVATGVRTAEEATAGVGDVQNPLRHPLLHLFALPGFGKTTIGQAIVREASRTYDWVIPLLVDFSNGDQVMVPDCPLEQLLCLALIAHVFYGTALDHLLLHSNWAKEFQEQLSLEKTLIAISTHFAARSSHALLLYIHFDEYQRLPAEMRSKLLRLLWAWTGARSDGRSKALLHNLVILPLLTGTSSVVGDAVKISGDWGQTNLLPLTQPFSPEAALELAMRGFPSAVSEHPTASQALRLKQQKAAWSKGLELPVAATGRLPRFLM